LSFSYARRKKNERLPFQRKGQGQVNRCPFDREPHANKANQIKAYQPRKGNGDIGSAQESKEITKSQRFGEFLRIL